MRELRERVVIDAPLARCFALSTNVVLVQKTLGMKLVDGPAFVVGESRVHWRGWKFGLPTEHHTLITGFEAPHWVDGKTVAFFQDSQERGRFAAFRHDHCFTQVDGCSETTLEDRISFALPWFLGGVLAERWLLGPHIRRLARKRFALLKRIAEGEEWRRYLAAS